MIGTDLAVAGGVLLFTVAVGLVAHECAHALVLRLARIDYTVRYFPGRTDGVVGLLASCPWAVVRPAPSDRDAPLPLRIAALAPAVLAVPIFALGLSGLAPADSPIATAVAIGWLACAIPSPQDFSVVFHAHRALENATPSHGSEATDQDAVSAACRAD